MLQLVLLVLQLQATELVLQNHVGAYPSAVALEEVAQAYTRKQLRGLAPH
jgi:hypothetical protein